MSLYERVRDEAGSDAVYQKAVEELTECSLAIQHRNKIPSWQLIDELADAMIVIEQCIEMVGACDVTKRYYAKLGRLEMLLREGKLKDGMA